MSTIDDIIPKENVLAYKTIFCIEVGLREFVIQELEKKCGPKWWKERLPRDILSSCREGLQRERGIKWCELFPHHPIYYIDFPDLKKIIERSDNWNDAFQPFFARKDILAATLSELEPIRNCLAHNRRLTVKDLQIAQGGYQKITAAIGEERFFDLASRCTMAKDIPERLLDLRKEAEFAFGACRNLKPLSKLKAWPKIRSSWWFDADYLGKCVDAIIEYFDALRDYSELPRARGSGHRIEAWVRAKNLQEKYSKATKQFSTLSKEAGGTEAHEL